VGKFIAGLFRFIVLLAMLGAIGFLYFEVRRLDGEVAELKRRSSAVVKTSRQERPSFPASGPTTTEERKQAAGLLDTARGHVEQAETLIRRKDYRGAMRALGAATEAVRDAGEEAQARSRQSVAELTKTITTLKKKVETLAAALRSERTDAERLGSERLGENR
jgi:predicted lipid-binding transport protein (Tim44 family)